MITLLLIDHPTTETWRPDFGSSGQGSPKWTRLQGGGHELANSLEAPDWEENPVQVVVCDSCGFVHCETGGYVHVSTTPKYVVWTLPQIDLDDEFEASQYEPAQSVWRSGGVLLPREIWDELAADHEWMPHSSALGALTGRALFDAWRHCGPPSVRSRKPAELVDRVSDQVVACDSLTPAEGLSHTRALAEWMTSNHDLPIHGDFVRPDAEVVTPEALHLDGSRLEEWVALCMVGNDIIPAFSRDWVFQPEAT